MIRNLELQKDPDLHGKEVIRQPRPLNWGIAAKMGKCALADGAPQEKDKGSGSNSSRGLRRAGSSEAVGD